MTAPARASTPLHLTATTTLGSNTTGGVNTVALKNPLGGAMEIREIKFAITGPPLYNGSSNVGYGGIIGAKLDVGAHPLTNGYVPVGNFGRPIGLFSEQILSNINNSISEFSWKLPRPLYVPAGAVITPTFQHRGLVTDSLSVRVSYSGRSVSGPMPKKIFIPYASCFVSKNFPSDTAGSDQSTELDLINPFDDVLYIHRFVGRCYFTNQGFVTEVGVGNDTAGREMFTVRMSDSNGRPIIRTFTVFRVAFPTPTRTWDLDGQAVMDPQSYYRVFVKKAAPIVGNFDTGPATTQVMMSCVGWREIGAES